VTALPYGINTVGVLGFIFLVMAPVYARTKDPELTWKVGLFACFLSGIIQTFGAFGADWIRRHTPRAALLCPLAGIAITFLATSFVFQAMSRPLLAFVPMMLTITVYAAGIKLPGRIPGAAVVIGLGLILAQAMRMWGAENMPPQAEAGALGFLPPVPVNIFHFMFSREGLDYLGVIIPIGIMDVLGSLQALESAEAAGDRYETRSSLLVNGAGTLVAACFGSAFPTALYIGHPAWKKLGARSGYSTLCGLCLLLVSWTGATGVVLRYVPVEIALGILLWVGLVMTVQAFAEVPVNHMAAVAFGLIPGLAGWVLVLVDTGIRKAGSSLFAAAPHFGEELHIYGVIALSQGSLVTSMLWTAILVQILEKRFVLGAAWCAASAVLAYVGLIHAYTLTENGVMNHFGWGAAGEYAIVYSAVAGMLLLLALAQRRGWIQVGVAEH
jgi:AGZA family xanthine/uracil permease-like MFS transporter